MTTVYLALPYVRDGFPLDRIITSTPELARRHLERVIEQSFGWKPGEQRFHQGTWKTATFRWIDTRDAGGAIYGDWPADVVTFEQSIDADIDRDALGRTPELDERGVAIPLDYQGTIGVVYAIEIDAVDQVATEDARTSPPTPLSPPAPPSNVPAYARFIPDEEESDGPDDPPRALS